MHLIIKSVKVIDKSIIGLYRKYIKITHFT